MHGYACHHRYGTQKRVDKNLIRTNFKFFFFLMELVIRKVRDSYFSENISYLFCTILDTKLCVSAYKVARNAVLIRYLNNFVPNLYMNRSGSMIYFLGRQSSGVT